MRDWFRHFRRPSDKEFAAEIEAHLAHETDEQIDRGVPPEEARYAALRRFGNVTRHLERFREGSPWFWLETAWQDVRYAARMLHKSRGFTVVAVLSLALGIGLNAVLFGAIHAVLLQPLPYEDPERLVEIHHLRKSGVRFGVPPAAYLEWVRASQSFDALAIFDGFNGQAVFRDREVVEHIEVLRVSSSFFDVLGTRAALGRVLIAGDDKRQLAVISDDWWQRRWQRDAGIIGRAITIDNAAYQVVGVMPRGFRFYRQRRYGSGSDTTDVWLSDPFKYVPADNDLLDVLSAVGRLKLGVTPTHAAAELGAVSIGLRRDRGLPDDLAGVTVVRLRDSLTESSERTLFVSWAIAALVLLIAATNLAVLVLARTEARRSELNLRGAVGAGRGRLVRQLLTESAVLAALAGAVGAGVVAWTGPLLDALLPRADMVVRLGEAGATWQVVVFTSAATAVSVLLFGAIPAWVGSRSAGLAASHWNRTTSSRRSARVRESLLVLQLSLSVLVVAATALLVATAWREQHVPLGFSPDHLLTLNIRYPRDAPYVTGVGVRSLALGLPGSAEQHSPFIIRLPHYALTPYGEALPRRLAERLAAVPGADAAAVASSMPMLRSLGEAFRVEGRPVPADEADAVWGMHCRITPDYFRTLGMRLLRGRSLSEADTGGSPKVMVVNETLARAFLGGVDRAIGQRVIVNPGAVGMDVAYEVVGVISDARFFIRNDVGPQMYTSFDQSVDDAYGAIAMIWRLDFWVAVRTRDTSPATVAAVLRAVDAVDGGAPVQRVEFMDRIIARGSENARGLLRLLIVSAVTAVFLSAIGVFGVTAYGVSQRVREFGIRVAVGASPRAIASQVLWSGMRLAVAGVLVGALGAFWTNRLLERELYDVSPTDPWVFAAAACLLSAVVLVAAWLPARRAARIDPVMALRAE